MLLIVALVLVHLELVHDLHASPFLRLVLIVTGLTLFICRGRVFNISIASFSIICCPTAMLSTLVRLTNHESVTLHFTRGSRPFFIFEQSIVPGGRT